jgi:hypothetical protein
MSSRDRRPFGRLPHPVWPLVVLLCLGLLAGGAGLPHLHESATSGFYNEAHVLEALAIVSVATPTPSISPPPGSPPPLAVDVADTATNLPRPLRALAESRAPPLA